jgi:hypothetical protein
MKTSALLNTEATSDVQDIWTTGTYPLPVANGGTGATTAAGALSSLGAAQLSGATFTGSVVVTSPIQINPIGTATSVSGNYSSYNFQELGSYWNGTVASGDTWTMNDVLGTGTAPTSTLTIQHTGSSGLATVSVPSLTAGAGFAVAASGATSVTASGVSVVPLTLYGRNVSQTADLLDVYNYSGGSIVAAITPAGGLAGSSLVITGCGAGYYAKADGAGCGIPAGTYSLPAQYKTWSCQPGLGDGLNAITAGTYLQTECKNTTGVSVTLTGLSCYVDGGTSSTMNASGNTLGALLTGAVTCSTSFAAGTQSANVTLTNGDYIKFTFVADGTAKQTTWVVTGTY